MLLLTDKLAMSVHAQLIANSALGDHGPLAANHAMEVYHQELELSLTPLPTEDRLVMLQLKLLLAMSNHVLSTVLFLIGEYGANAPLTVEGDQLPEQEPFSPLLHLVDVHAQV